MAYSEMLSGQDHFSRQLYRLYSTLK
jgi:hypothetical protein